MTIKLVECSVGRPLTEEEARTWEAAGISGKAISREALDRARAFASSLPDQMDLWEQARAADLLKDEAIIRQFHEALRLSVLHVPPEGLGHEPQVLAWREWERVELPKIMEEWSQMLIGIPRDSYRRLEELVKELPRLKIEREARSKNAKKGAAVAKAANPAVRAMDEIRKAWSALQVAGAPYPGDASFAKTVHSRYAHVISNEGSIKNAISRWRREARERGQ